jgi:hypothetical protein
MSVNFKGEVLPIFLISGNNLKTSMPCLLPSPLAVLDDIVERLDLKTLLKLVGYLMSTAEKL